ncbi:MAG: NAD-dependent deacylase [Deltaproteobacteria bacterium]|nr:NAD-dependent deacylase [Deltaproteobacteria bacterium]
MERLIAQAAEIICNAKLTMALTGAGISVESGIPDFRSAGGLWSKYNPDEYATISAFRQDPEKVWKMLRDMEELIINARPNRAHIGMGELEKMGFLHYIITQNVDNLHQAGGAKNVIEYHGNSSTLSCLWCEKGYTVEEKKGVYPPRCECGKILKPGVVMFGEAIPPGVLNRSFQIAASAKALMIVATSAVVSPANTIPGIAKQNGAKIIEINKEKTHLTESLTDVFIQGEAGEIIAGLVVAIKERAGLGI